eukprot:7808165-Pyramimonas_sp.AAC.1
MPTQGHRRHAPELCAKGLHGPPRPAPWPRRGGQPASCGPPRREGPGEPPRGAAAAACARLATASAVEASGQPSSRCTSARNRRGPPASGARWTPPPRAPAR